VSFELLSKLSDEKVANFCPCIAEEQKSDKMRKRGRVRRRKG
jgi:hypothetical protein